MTYLYWLTHQFGAEAGVAYRDWYASLEKPFFAPPAWLFGIAWGCVYPLIAIAFALTLFLWRKKRVSSLFVLLFAANIAANLTFSPTVLALASNAANALHILVVFGTLVPLVAVAWRDARLVFWLLVPYLLWSAYATALQLGLLFLN
ncbi:MAG TPA: TspO/MBR family protein [Candidatus Paceibacterota bacterium]|nr:TspO/MBR family protein [Candidatus Paceibacterota bacterium]